MKTTDGKDILLTLAIGIALAGGSPSSRAEGLVYGEDFEADHSADGTWVVNSTGGYNPVDLFFDYSTVGIPPAPHSVGGSTRGLKLQANLVSFLQQFPSGSSASPMTFSIPENFEMRWDWWINFNGPLPAGGSGSTQVGGGGFGTAASSAQAAGGPIDCILVAATGEPTGSAADYRLYAPNFPASFQDASGVYAAPNLPSPFGARNNLNPYYQAVFPSVFAPWEQVALYPQQGGLTQGGSVGMAWHAASLKKTGNVVIWSIDGVLIATVDLSICGVLGGNKIVFSHFDINGSASTDPYAPAMAFSLVDNIRVIDPCLDDHEPPTITTAGNVIIPATSPVGAVVAFDVTASDNCPNQVTLVCEPPSGNIFPIGTTTVTCIAEDASGNTTLISFTVAVQGAAEQIIDLIGYVQAIPILPGFANSLVVKLQEASAALSRGEANAACGVLKAFIAEVSAQAAKREITQAQASQLIHDASRIGDVIGCAPAVP